MIEPQSPYLSHQHRLADVVAAIQVMGIYSYSARTIDSWAEILGQKPRSASSWGSIFNEHPEFFGRDWKKMGFTPSPCEGPSHAFTTRKPAKRLLLLSSRLFHGPNALISPGRHCHLSRCSRSLTWRSSCTRKPRFVGKNFAGGYPLLSALSLASSAL